MATVYGPSPGWWKTALTYWFTETDTTFTINASLGVYSNKTHGHDLSGDRPCYLSCNGDTTNYYPSGTNVKLTTGTIREVGSRSWTFNKSTAEYNVTLTGSIRHNVSGSSMNGTSTVDVTVTVPKVTYTLNFDTEGGAGDFNGIKHQHGVAVTLPTQLPTKDGYDCLGWADDPSSASPSYYAGETYTINQNHTIYAIYHVAFVRPSIDELRAYRVDDSASGKDPAVKPDGTRCYCDFTYTPPVAGTTNSIIITFGTSPVSASVYGSLRYAYTEANHLPTTSKEEITITIRGVTYNGTQFEYTYSTYVSTENYVFDAFKGIHGSEEYQSFAIGGMARDFSNNNRSPEGNFDIYMDVSLVLAKGVQITDTGSSISVTKTGSEETDDYLLAKAIADTFDYQTAKEILEV